MLHMWIYDKEISSSVIDLGGRKSNHMKKDITICFRTNSDIRNSLEKIAEEERQSLSSVIETILFNNLRERKALQSIEQERRKFTRKKVALPAFVGESSTDARGYQTGTIMDISLGGIRVAVPKGTVLEFQHDTDEEEFHVIFTLPGQKRPISMKCKPCCVQDADEDRHVGASFVDSDFKSYRSLQQYLI
jgi:hypothetical protein